MLVLLLLLLLLSVGVACSWYLPCWFVVDDMPCRSRSYFLCSFSTSVLQSSPCLSVHPSIPWHIRTPNDKILKYAHNLYIKREEQYILCAWMTGVVVVLVLVAVVYCALCVFHILSFKEKYFVRGPQFRNFVLSSSFWWIKTAVEQPEKLIRVPLFVCDSSSGSRTRKRL